MKAIRSKRTLTINPFVEVAEVLSIYDYTPQEIEAAWYDEQDMEKITHRCFRAVHRMECGGSKSGKKYCTRGLEGLTTLGSISKTKTRTAAFAAVLEEQERQWNENEEIDDEAISDAYKKTCTSSQLWAQVIGNRDRQAAESFLYDDEDEYEQVDATTPVSVKSAESPSQKRILKVKESEPGIIIHQNARAA